MWDGHLMLCDLDAISDEYNHIHSQIAKEGPHLQILIINGIEKFQRELYDFVKTMNRPPNINENVTEDLLSKLRHYPLVSLRNIGRNIVIHLWKDDRMLMSRVIPIFLKQHSEKASALWLKLYGDESVHNINIFNNTYLIKRNKLAGFLYTEELVELKNELNQIQIKIKDVDGEIYKFWKHEMHYEYVGPGFRLIELVNSLAMIGTEWIEKNILLGFIGD